MYNLGIGWWFLILMVGILVIVLLGKHLLKIINLCWKLLLQIALGFIIIFFFNIIGQLTDFYLPLNIITASVAGILRLPGLIILIIIKILFI